MPRGYDRSLYTLPFDHRGSFQTQLFGWKPPLSNEQISEISTSNSAPPSCATQSPRGS